MKRILIGCIKLYQKIPGPWHSSCRHIPTCSNYGIEAIEKHGSIKGSFLTVKRILKCNPFGTYGYDPVPKIRRKKMKKKILGILLCCTFMTGCFKSDNMENIKIKTTVYPIEYITSILYGKHANAVGSIYPDSIKLDNYKLTNKQLNDFSNNDLFIYNGTSNEPDYAINLLNINKNIKIIDAAKGMEFTNDTEELWLDPSNFLMLAQNIKAGFNEYVDDPYLMEEIQKNYDKLNIQVSALDVEFDEVSQHATNKSIIVSNDLFKFLEKYGFNVISLEENNKLNDKIISDAKKLINNGTIQYIFIRDNEELNPTVKNIVDSTDVEVVSLHSLSILSEEDRKNELDYISIMKSNIEKIRKELYK